MQIVSKSRRRGGLYILLENHRNIGAVNYGFELFHWLPWPWPAFPDSAIFSVLCVVFLSFFFQPLRFHHGRLPPQVFFFTNALQHTESTFSEQFQAFLGLLACADVAAATQNRSEKNYKFPVLTKVEKILFPILWLVFVKARVEGDDLTPFPFPNSVLQTIGLCISIWHYAPVTKVYFVRLICV